MGVLRSFSASISRSVAVAESFPFLVLILLLHDADPNTLVERYSYQVVFLQKSLDYGQVPRLLLFFSQFDIIENFDVNVIDDLYCNFIHFAVIFIADRPLTPRNPFH